MRSTYRIAIAGLMLFSLFTSASAQDQYAFVFRPNSGDIWIDTRLDDFNEYASGHVDGFVDEVVVSYDASRQLVHEYVVQRRWPPGDVYYACALAYYSHRSCEVVLNMHRNDYQRGWSGIAKRLGVTPGSPAYRALKDNIGKAHDKWHGKPVHDKSDHDKG